MLKSRIFGIFGIFGIPWPQPSVVFHERAPVPTQTAPATCLLAQSFLAKSCVFFFAVFFSWSHWNCESHCSTLPPTGFGGTATFGAHPLSFQATHTSTDKRLPVLSMCMVVYTEHKRAQRAFISTLNAVWESTLFIFIIV